MRLNIFKIPADDLEPLKTRHGNGRMTVVRQVSQDRWDGSFYLSIDPEPSEKRSGRNARDPGLHRGAFCGGTVLTTGTAIWRGFCRPASRFLPDDIRQQQRACRQPTGTLFQRFFTLRVGFGGCVMSMVGGK